MAILLNLDKTQIINKDTFALLVTVARTYNYVRITIVQREYSFGEIRCMLSYLQDELTVSRPRWRSVVASVVETASSMDTWIRYADFTSMY